MTMPGSRPRVARRLLGALFACLLAVAAVLGPPRSVRAAVEPALRLTPNRGPCGAPITARGAHFPPGETVELYLPRDPKRPPAADAAQPTATVAADGTFAVEIVPCTAETPGYDQDGAQYVIGAVARGPYQDGPPQSYATAVFTVGPVADVPIPTLTLTPDHGACNSPVVLRGANFPPGERILLHAFPVRSDHGVQFADATADAVGGFTVPIEMGRATNCNRYYPVSVGTAYRITAALDERAAANRHASASAIYTVSEERLTTRCFAETGRCASGRFLEYWEFRSLPVNGYPISEEFDQRLEDGRTYRAQYFERVRLEYHPEHQPPHDVLLGQFGRRIHPDDGAVPPREAESTPAEPVVYVPETRHNLRGRFLSYWENNGAIPQFGYPISEEFEEQLEDGNVYLVQYFERARFEYHPEHRGTPYAVLIGQFGRRILAGTAPSALAFDPPVRPCAAAAPAVPPRGGFRPGVVTSPILWRDRDGALNAGNPARVHPSARSGGSARAAP